jgi:probable F420-dependent oxidoreductase
VLLGLITPALTMLPSAHAAWEESATWDDVVEIARAADRLGYHHLTCSEHIAVPDADAAERGGRYWDPLATFGFLAAVTTSIRFATYVLVLGYHHPLELVKRYGTLDQVSGGRLILGVGVGTLRPEFELLDAPFADRGARADDALRALRASFGHGRPEYHGDHYDYAGLVVEPAGVQRDVPIWIGGQGARSLHRAVELGDGWAPFGLKPAVARELLADTNRADLDVILQPPRPLDTIGEAGRAQETLEELRDAGATHATLRFVHHSVAHFIEQLEATRELMT